MRINTPVTEHEVDFPEACMIVSRTDLKGRITYVNRDFIEISGFTEAELIGQPHNIVRHPSMPPAAFEDMWTTLKEGRPWTGMVKNRCKNGDYYWVQANATPLRENGTVTGYMSVRTKPTRAQVEAADRAYREIVDGNPHKLGVYRGRVVRGKRERRTGLSLAARTGLLAGSGLALAALAAIAGAGGLLNDWLGASAFCAVAAVVLGVQARRLYAQMSAPLAEAREWLGKMTEGDLRSAYPVKREDEIGAVLEAARSLQIKVGFDISEMQRVSSENHRVRMALENSEANVMIADADGIIVYLNKTVRGMFEKNAEALRTVMPGFNPDTLIGTNFDAFHRNPAHQRSLLGSLNGAHRTQVKVAGLIFGLIASPVTDERGKRVGYVVEWQDLTAIKGEIAGLVNAASRGDFSLRGKPENHVGEYRDVVLSLNAMMDASDAGLNAVAEVLKRVAQGDLTRRVEGKLEGRFGELQRDTNATIEQLTQIVQQIQGTANVMRQAVGEMAQGNSDLSQRTEEQASSLEETAAAMEQLASTVRNNAENAKEANALAGEATTVAARGGDAVRQFVETMAGISESSRKIGDIIGVIDGIAFQTNILALNAAVEAARAGEQGKGFAVVASEVRSLAQRSADAAKQIKGLIETSVARVDSGSRLVDEAGGTMQEIVASVQKVNEIVGGITAASREQSIGIDQVNEAITQMDEVTQKNAALVEEAAASAESLEQQAEQLVSTVAVFRLAHAGADGQAGVTQASRTNLERRAA